MDFQQNVYFRFYNTLLNTITLHILLVSVGHLLLLPLVLHFIIVLLTSKYSPLKIAKNIASI